MSNISIQDVVEIGSDLYAKNQEALQSLLEELKKQSYEVKDCNDSKKDARRDKPSREVQEQQGWTLWFATLGEPAYQRVGKCDSCGSYIAIAGIQSHKHKCEVCGAYTFLEFFDGTIVKFSFYSTEEQSLFPPCLRMRVYDYDEEAECLFLYPTPEKGRGLFELSTEKAEQILEENEDKLTRIERDGKDLLSVPYTLDWNKKNEVIDVSDISGYKRNYKIVKLFKGKEYGELEKLPVPESYSIFEAWHWVPLTSSPTLHERIIGAACMVSDCGYYYQDGRPAFYEIHLERMRLFVEHFTILDIKKWDQMIERAPRSGPGMIRAIARFCFDNPQIENAPNIGNLIVGLGKAFSKEPLTKEEKVAMAEALADEEIQKSFLRKR